MNKLFYTLTMTMFLLLGCAPKDTTIQTPQETAAHEQKVEPKIYIEEKDTKNIYERKTDIIDGVALSKREQIVRIAMSYLGKRDGRDCSGFVNLVNVKTGQPFYGEKELSQSFDNARKSRAMYNLMGKKGDTFENKLPRIGDLVFFEDTERRKTKVKNKVAENITHVGIVTRVDADKTVEFIHHSNGKNILDYMNFALPSQTKNGEKVVNTYMKRCKSKKGEVKTECLNLAFFVAYGTF